MFIKRRLIPNKGFCILCLQNMKFPSMSLPKKYCKEKTITNFTSNLKKNNYLVSYDSLTEFEPLVINNSLPNSNSDFFIPIICFLSL
jgi:hypothetical protein